MYITDANSKLKHRNSYLRNLTSVYLPGRSVMLTTVLVLLFALKMNYADIVCRDRNIFLIKIDCRHFKCLVFLFEDKDSHFN